MAEIKRNQSVDGTVAIYKDLAKKTENQKENWALLHDAISTAVAAIAFICNLTGKTLKGTSLYLNAPIKILFCSSV